MVNHSLSRLSNPCILALYPKYRAELMTNRDFALPRVKSINTSGHKFGLVYAGG